MRTKGAVSYTLVTLSELNRIFKPETQIPISLSFAKALNFSENKNKTEIDSQETESIKPIEIVEVI